MIQHDSTKRLKIEDLTKSAPASSCDDRPGKALCLRKNWDDGMFGGIDQTCSKQNINQTALGKKNGHPNKKPLIMMLIVCEPFEATQRLRRHKAAFMRPLFKLSATHGEGGTDIGPTWCSFMAATSLRNAWNKTSASTVSLNNQFPNWIQQDNLARSMNKAWTNKVLRLSDSQPSVYDQQFICVPDSGKRQQHATNWSRQTHELDASGGLSSSHHPGQDFVCQA